MYENAMGGLDWPVAQRNRKWTPNRAVTACGPGGGPAVTNQAWPSCGQFVIGPPWQSSASLPVWVWGRWVQKVNQFSPNSVYETGFKLDAAPAGQYGRQGAISVPYGPGLAMPSNPSQAPRFGYPAFPTPLPRGLSPHQPDAPGLRETETPARPNPGRFTYTRPDPRQDPDAPPRPGTDPHTPTPPGPGVKEKKVKVPSAMRTALSVAHAATETKDAIDAIFKALPKSVRDSAPKTGRVMPGGRLPPGTRYTSTYDKARHIYDNWDQLDPRKAALELLKNHLTDAAIGRLFGGADAFSNRNLFGNRFVFT